MTGAEFENAFVRWLWQRGYWAKALPRDRTGAQPFDVIAIRGTLVIAADCKVCEQPRFELRRIEDNQRLAFEVIRQRVDVSKVGFVCYYHGGLYFIPFSDTETADGASIRLEHKYFIGEL